MSPSTAPPPPPEHDRADVDLRAIGDRIEALLDHLRGAEPRAYDQAEELVRLLTELYGAGLARVVALLPEERLDTLVDDELVASLLVLHDLHPLGLRARVERALASVRPLLAQHGGGVELLDVDDEVAAVHLRLVGSCDGCPSSALTLRQSVEAAILELAPEVVAIDVAEPAEPGHDVGLLDLDLEEGEVRVTMGRKAAHSACPTNLPTGLPTSRPTDIEESVAS